MTIINSEIILDLYCANLMYEIHKLEEKKKFFEHKYSCRFAQFEQDMVSSGKENFTRWDDYMEWKAYENLLLKYRAEKKDIEIGDYKVS